MRLRSGRVSDVETYARLINAQHQWLRNENLWEIDELAALLVTPSSDPVRYDRYLEVDGTVVAGLHTHASPPYEKVTFHLASPPEPNREAHARYLLEAGLRLLRGRPELSPAAAISIDVPSEDEELTSLVRSMGFARTNQVAIMQATIDNAPEPTWPDGFTVQTFDFESDLQAAFSIISSAFANQPAWWHIDQDDFVYMLQNDPTARRGISVLVTHGDVPAAISVNFADTTLADTGLIGLLAVAPGFQGRGLGRAILLESFVRFRAQDWQYARLATIYGYRPGEPSLYNAVGMKPMYFNDMFVRSLD